MDIKGWIFIGDMVSFGGRKGIVMDINVPFAEVFFAGNGKSEKVRFLELEKIRNGARMITQN